MAIPKRFPPEQRLADAMMDTEGIPKEMIVRAMRGEFGDFTSPHAAPMQVLVGELIGLGALALVERVKRGEFDG